MELKVVLHWTVEGKYNEGLPACCLLVACCACGCVVHWMHELLCAEEKKKMVNQREWSVFVCRVWRLNMGNNWHCCKVVTHPRKTPKKQWLIFKTGAEKNIRPEWTRTWIILTLMFCACGFQRDRATRRCWGSHKTIGRKIRKNANNQIKINNYIVDIIIKYHV